LWNQIEKENAINESWVDFWCKKEKQTEKKKQTFVFVTIRLRMVILEKQSNVLMFFVPIQLIYEALLT